MVIDPLSLHAFTEVKLSHIPGAGLGLFATKMISQGTVWWQATEDNFIAISRQQYNRLQRSHLAESKMSTLFFQTVCTYSYLNSLKNELMLMVDNTRFVNHDRNPNSCLTSDKIKSIALRNIEPGEEITEDYRTYGMNAWCEQQWDFI